MKLRFTIKKTAFLLALCVLLLNAVGRPRTLEISLVGEVPRKAVPSEFQGQFTSVHNRGAYTDRYGGSYSGISWGTVLNLKPDGTGTWVFRYDITYTSGRQKKVHIDCDVTYEITKKNGNRADIVIHFIRGKNCEDGKFLHDLDASKLYPNGDTNWTNVEYGINAQGKPYFIPSADDTFTKT